MPKKKLVIVEFRQEDMLNQIECLANYIANVAELMLSLAKQLLQIIQTITNSDQMYQRTKHEMLILHNLCNISFKVGNMLTITFSAIQKHIETRSNSICDFDQAFASLEQSVENLLNLEDENTMSDESRALLGLAIIYINGIMEFIDGLEDVIMKHPCNVKEACQAFKAIRNFPEEMIKFMYSIYYNLELKLKENKELTQLLVTMMGLIYKFAICLHAYSKESLASMKDIIPTPFLRNRNKNKPTYKAIETNPESVITTRKRQRPACWQ